MPERQKQQNKKIKKNKLGVVDWAESIGSEVISFKTPDG